MAISASETRHHLLLFCYDAWGHARTMCNFATRVVQARPIYVTLLTSPAYYDRVVAEVSRNFLNDEQLHAKWLRVIALPEPANPLNMPAADELFAAAYRTLAAGESLTCGVTNTPYPAVIPPSTVITEFFALGPLQTCRQFSSVPVKVLAWQAVAVPYLLRLFGPTTVGGIGDLPKAVSVAASSGQSELEAMQKFFQTAEGKVVTVPGVPDMYDWECFPQPIPEPLLAGISARAYQFFQECDGAIHTTHAAWEADALKGFAEWFGASSRPSYAIGPILARGKMDGTDEGELRQSVQAQEIIKFLDENLASRGPHSVLYIGFGSFWWPAEPEKLFAILEVAMQMNIPFILSRSSPVAALPDGFQEKVKASGLGIISPWTPQQLILKHAATGWFVTHCGQNSVLEAFAASVPMIAWPLAVDQPQNAAHLVDMGMAYELFEVRSGPNGLKPILRTGKTPQGTLDSVMAEAREVLGKAFSEKGEGVRAKVKEMQGRLNAAWDADGPASLGLQAFLDELDR